MHEACYYEKKDTAITCTLCPQACTIDNGKVGLCSVRFNKAGTLYALTYGRVSSRNLDPVEKKPLYHFYPGTYIYSVGSLGCNLGCSFCQNWEIAQIKDYFIGEKPQTVIDKATVSLEPEKLVQEAKSLSGNIGIAYTYNEPFIWFEYILESARLAKNEGLKNVFVTNGYVMPKPLSQLLPLIDAMNIDLKGFTQDVYSELGARLAPVKNTIKKVGESDCHLEVTHLLVPKLNDDLTVFKEMVNWLADAVGSEVPLHISRYFPTYKYIEQATPVSLMKQAAEIAEKKLKFVYLGNV